MSRVRLPKQARRQISSRSFVVKSQHIRFILPAFTRFLRGWGDLIDSAINRDFALWPFVFGLCTVLTHHQKHGAYLASEALYSLYGLLKDTQVVARIALPCIAYSSASISLGCSGSFACRIRCCPTFKKIPAKCLSSKTSNSTSLVQDRLGPRH